MENESSPPSTQHSVLFYAQATLAFLKHDALQNWNALRRPSSADIKLSSCSILITWS
jgi:hypothetical protein